MHNAKNPQFMMAKARSELIRHQPFFGTLALRLELRPIENPLVHVMGTDGRNLYYNPLAIPAITQSEVVVIIAHEVLHCAFQHIFRKGHRDKALWNMACDYVVNAILLKERYSLPEAAVAAAAALPLKGMSAAAAELETTGPARVETEIVRLKLRHTWTTTMSSSEFRDTFHVKYTRDGITGIGEGAPIARYHESAEGAKQAVDGLVQYLTSADPRAYDKFLAGVLGRIENQWAATAAIDISLLDWVGKRLGVPIHGLFGLDPADAPITTFSIGIDTPEITRQKVREAEPYPVL